MTATAVDAAGNVFLAGNFINMVVLGGTTLTSLGSSDVFVAKFNPISNQFVWAQRAGGTSVDEASALAVSAAGVYVAGEFDSPTVGFGSATLANADPNTNNFTGTPDVFVAKLTDAGSTGSFAWAQRAGGTGFDYAAALAVSGAGVYVAGRFGSPTAGFGSAILVNADANRGTFDVFITKLTDAGGTGSFAWTQQAGGTCSDQANALAVSGTSVYVAGAFNSPTAGFGSATLANAGAYDMFITKLTDAGGTSSFAWAERAGGTGFDFPAALAVSGTSVYVAGSFDSPTAGFGSATLVNMGSSSTADVFVAKLTDAGGTGSFAWAQRAGGISNDFSNALAVSGTSVYVAGEFRSPTAGFGTITLSNPNSISPLGFLASLTDATPTAITAATGPREPATLFPNPAQHTAILRLPAGTAPAPLTLTDALGRAVRRYPAPTSPEAVLDLRGLPAGLYLLRGAGPAQRLVVE